MHDLRQAVRGFRAGSLFLAAGLVLCAVYFSVAAGNTQSVIYDAIGVGSSIAIAAGVYLNKPDYRLPWLLFAIGNLFFAVADIIFNIIVNPPVPSVADWFYLAGYPVLTCGLVLLVVRAGGHHRLAAIDEAAIVTIAFALFQWVWIMDSINEGPGSVTERAVNMAYPGMDVLLLAGLAGFFVTAAWRTPSFVMLVLSLTALLVSDDVFGLQRDTYTSGDLTDLGWLLSYILWAAAALHPSMRELSKPRRRHVRLRIHPVRIVLLTVALLSAPGVLLIQHIRAIHFDPYAIVLGGGAIAILVVARLVGILRALERIREREQAARAEAEQTQRLLALQNEQLLEADKLKDEFVALISHDLRTPLTSIIAGGAALGSTSTTAEERAELSAAIVAEGGRLSRLVENLLDMSRLEAGKAEPHREQTDLGEVIEGARDAVADSPLVRLSLSAGLPTVQADPSQLERAFANLLENAIRHGGGRPVRVTSRRIGGKIAVRVVDQGPGIPESERRRIFEPFQHGETASAGSGLGLAIAKGFVEANGGEIEVESLPGQGSSFVVSFRCDAGAGP